MADEIPTFQFEDVPLDDARRMGRGPRMEPMLYDTLRHKIQALSSEATRIRLGPEITPQRMKNYILRMARELNVPVTVRRVPGGVIFWRSSEEDLQQAQGTASRLHPAQRQGRAHRGRRKRPSSITPLRGEEHTMATYEDVLAEILYEVTNRPRVSVQALIAPLSEVLGYETKLEDTRTETERDAWLMKLRLEKPRILHWLAERGHP
jgi:hypothetical protein